MGYVTLTITERVNDAVVRTEDIHFESFEDFMVYKGLSSTSDVVKDDDVMPDEVVGEDKPKLLPEGTKCKIVGHFVEHAFDVGDIVEVTDTDEYDTFYSHFVRRGDEEDWVNIKDLEVIKEDAQ